MQKHLVNSIVHEYKRSKVPRRFFTVQNDSTNAQSKHSTKLLNPLVMYASMPHCFLPQMRIVRAQVCWIALAIRVWMRRELTIDTDTTINKLQSQASSKCKNSTLGCRIIQQFCIALECIHRCCIYDSTPFLHVRQCISEETTKNSSITTQGTMNISCQELVCDLR